MNAGNYNILFFNKIKIVELFPFLNLHLLGFACFKRDFLVYNTDTLLRKDNFPGPVSFSWLYFSLSFSFI